METVIRTGAQAVSTSKGSSYQSCPPIAKSSFQSLSGSSWIRRKNLDRCSLRLTANYRTKRFSVRAEQPIDGKVREIASEEAVEGPGYAEKNAKLKSEELKSESSSTELPIAADLLLNAISEEDENGDLKVVKDAALGVASSSAVEDGKTFFNDVEDAELVAAAQGRSVEDAAVGPEEKVEGLEDRQVKEAELLEKKEFNGTGTEASSAIEGGVEVPQTRGEAEEKILETARDGYEVLKFAAESVVSAGQNARGGLGIAKEAINKRLKAFGIAADDTQDVSSQVADIAQKNLEQIQGATSKFGEELQVNIEEKKAADSLKPESERDPLSRLGAGVQDTLNKSTAEDGPLSQLSRTVSENLDKASKAGQDFTTRVSERAAELSSKAEEAGEGTKAEISSKTEEFGGDAKEELVRDYEDELGNEMVKKSKGSEAKAPLKFEVDEAQLVPSRKNDESDIGPDE